jgi:DNA-3-methyladenine glycosylase I
MSHVRCFWCNLKNPAYIEYHDSEWGVPVRDDSKLFELLVLESFQAGLSWETILNKRENFRQAFDNFDPQKISQYGEDKITLLLSDAGIVRSRRKIEAANP